MKRWLRYSLMTVGFFLIVFLLFIGSLFFREQRLPQFVVSWLESKAGSENVVVRIDAAWFGFRHGLRVKGVRAYDTSNGEDPTAPVGRVQMATIDWFRREVNISGLEYKRLPASYYEPAKGPVVRGPMKVHLPDLPEFRVQLENPSFLGTNPSRVTARVAIGGERIAVSDLEVEFPDRERRLQVSGELTVDFEAQSLKASAKGAVLHSQVAPVIEVLDLPYVLPYVEAFTNVSAPVQTTYGITASLYTGDLDMRFDLKVPGCRYYGVPMAASEGVLSIRTYHVDEEDKFRFTVDLTRAEDKEGRTLTGRLTIGDQAGPIRLSYAARSTLKFEDLLAIIHELDPEDFSFMTCEAAPEIVAKGTVGLSPEDLDGNDLTGTLTCRQAKLGPFGTKDLSSEFTLKRDVLDVSGRARGQAGGVLEWTGSLALAGFEPDLARYAIKGSYKDGSLEEVADAFGFELGERKGRLEVTGDVNGRLGGDLLAGMNGSGSIRITDGNLARMKLFWGWMDTALAVLPGVSFVSERTEASGSFTIKDGVFTSEDAVVQGGLFSIKGRGTYDAAREALDFTTQVHLFRKESFYGMIVHPLTSAAMKLTKVLEFKLKGSLADPVWSYF